MRSSRRICAVGPRPAVGSAHGRLELLALAGRVTKAEVLGELA